MTVVHTGSRVATLVELLRVRADQLGGNTCLTVLADGESEQDRLSYEQLDRKARALAVRLTTVADPLDRAVLVYPPGVDFLVAFFGCLYAGLIAVPVAPPLDTATATRLAGVLRDAEPACVLTTTMFRDALVQTPAQLPALRLLPATLPPILATDDGTDADPADWRATSVDPQRIAMLQYTSGSTREPRGVMVTHANLMSNLEWLRVGMAVPERPTVVSWLPIYHDMGLIGSLFQTLYNGGDCVIMSPLDFLAKPSRWVAAISKYHASATGSPPFGYELCARKITEAELDGLDLREWDMACVTAEPIRATGLRQFAKTFARCGFRQEAFYPCYGLAETTLMVTGAIARTAPAVLRVSRAELQRGRAVTTADDADAEPLVSCGTARPEERVAIVDPDTAIERDPGEVGEIWVHGPNVTSGYWGREQETESTFRAMLSDGTGPFLRTGDLGFVRHDELYVTGRLKDLLIVHGRNLYPTDIEWAAQSTDRRLRPGCGAAFTVGADDDVSVVLVNEIDHTRSADWDEVGAAVCRGVAAHSGHAIRLVLIPGRTIPKTSSGKVQHGRCRSMYLANELPIVWSSDAPATSDIATRAPEMDAEQPILGTLRRLVASAVDQTPDRLDLDLPVNRLGLDSLRAIDIRDALASRLGADLALREFFGESTIRQLAERLSASAGTRQVDRRSPADPTARTERLEQPEFGLNELQQAYCTGRSADFELGDVDAHVYGEYETTDLDPARLEQAWLHVVDHYEALRTVVSANGTQHVLEHCPPWRLSMDDLRGQQPESAADLREQMSHQRFPLDSWPLFDIRVQRLDDDRWRVHLSAALLTLDAASLMIIVREWGELYRAAITRLSSDGTYRPIIEAQAALRESDGYHRSLSHWQRVVPALPPAPRLPLRSHEATRVRPGFVRHPGALPPRQWQSLTKHAADLGLTPTVALLAAYAEVLANWSEDPRFTVSVTMRHRPIGVGPTVGPFADFLPTGIDWSPSGSFAERAVRLRDRLLDDLDHREIGGVRILRELAHAQGLPRSRAAMPVVFTPVLRDLSAFDWLGEQVYGSSQTPQVYLDNQVFLRDGGLQFHWDAVDQLFPPGVAEDMVEAYSRLLEHLASGASAWTTGIDLLPEAQRQRRTRVNATSVPFPAVRLDELFLRQCERTPDAPALLCPTRSFTYQELRAAATDLAGWLQAQEIGPGALVAVVTEKGWEQVVAVLATLLCGAAYLPLAPDLPAARLAGVLDQAGATVVLTQTRLQRKVAWPNTIRAVPVDALGSTEASAFTPPTCTSPADRCCVFYTSGSTGTPKGVEVCHRGMVNAILDTNRTFDIGPADRALAITDLHHDMSAFDLFGPLAVGGAVVVVPPQRRRDPATWLALIERHRVTLWNSVPATMTMLIEHVEANDVPLCPSLRLVLLGGDWIPLELIDRIRDRAPAADIVSVGGPTETTLWNIWYRIGAIAPDWVSIPYGTPIANTHYYVLDAALRDRPDFVPGELCSAGPGTSPGYLNDPERTEAKFVEHPATGEMLCRTGDFGRWLPDGTIEMLGRHDGQIQLDGRRIELREIETVLARHPWVHSCAVTHDEHGHGRNRLVAHVVAAADVERADAPAALDTHLREQLPPHMIPGRLRLVDSIPLSANGKTDRQALMDGSRQEPKPPARSGGDTADTVADVVEKVLGRTGIPRDRDLADIGVGSLDMVRIANELEHAFGFRPDIDRLFTLSTVEALARYYGAETPGPAAVSAPQGPMIEDPDSRLAFRAQRNGLRRELRTGRAVIALPVDDSRRPEVFRRPTQRSFSPAPIPMAALTGLLGVLRDAGTSESAPRYAYGSGGGSYAVQTYLHIKANRVTDVPAGTYYYDPREHALICLGPNAEGCTRELHWRWNREPFDRAAFSVYLVAALDAIEPLYGDRSVHFATVEAGLMTQLLEMAATTCGLGLCQIGDLDFSRVASQFALDDRHVLVHSLLGGGIARPGEDSIARTADRAAEASHTGDLTRPASEVSVELLRAQATLDPGIRPAEPPPIRSGTQPPQVLLTGATGFLGGFVLHELLARGRHVTCLVRATDPDAALNRLQRNADRLGIGRNLRRCTLVALPGDISRPLLGLTRAQYDELTASVSAIYHCAAQVNWTKSYAELESAEVEGTREVLRAAVHQVPTPVHYVSSLAVFPFDGTPMSETHDLDHGGRLLGGYAQAKWVGEAVVAEAARRGLPLAIYRPPLISGHSRTGLFNPDSYFERMIKGCLEIGIAPRLGGVIDVAPVDYVAGALVDLAELADTSGQVFHLNNPEPMPFAAFIDWVRARGYDVGTVPFSQWQAGLAAAKPGALHPLADHLRHASPAHLTTAAHECARTVAVLASSGRICPPIDDTLLGTYFTAFENSGFLDGRSL
ncbi:amino acid adenylation domain-containing protein [Nocardia sp. NPDC051321]|uniref:amino acid adenylation domain-containing protein n=1 Tax=Nocardia sp. NPDC051321 TaxID=3364323 RepID=UPI00379A40EF